MMITVPYSTKIIFEPYTVPNHDGLARVSLYQVMYDLVKMPIHIKGDNSYINTNKFVYRYNLTGEVKEINPLRPPHMNMSKEQLLFGDSKPNTRIVSRLWNIAKGRNKLIHRRGVHYVILIANEHFMLNDTTQFNSWIVYEGNDIDVEQSTIRLFSKQYREL